MNELQKTELKKQILEENNFLLYMDSINNDTLNIDFAVLDNPFLLYIQNRNKYVTLRDKKNYTLKDFIENQELKKVSVMF